MQGFAFSPSKYVHALSLKTGASANFDKSGHASADWLPRSHLPPIQLQATQVGRMGRVWQTSVFLISACNRKILCPDHYLMFVSLQYINLTLATSIYSINIAHLSNLVLHDP